MQELAQAVVGGLASGGIYASLALAIVLIYRSTGVVNFAQGEMATFTTFVCWSLLHHDVSKWLAFGLTLAIAFAGGVALERTIVRPVEQASPAVVVILTIGLLVGLNGLTTAIWSAEVKEFPSAFPERSVEVAGVPVSWQDIGIVGVTLVAVAALAVFFRYTKLGLGLRAAAVNPEASRLVGVRVGWMLALGWGLAATLGALSGILIAPIVSLEPTMMQGVLLYALAAAVLGGLDSPVGAVVGGLALGVGINLLGTYVDAVDANLELAVALLVILAVLLVRPSGLLGRPAVSRV
ncbi:MAG: branched-chain amino acid ABC transporter permease [Thermoleophilia bacterium]|nr:branched-chain amino acid ABC transporter permease [Thermoleophilia bacterium]